MKRILISLSIIGAVAAIATGVTIALFNDTETSTGNIFVAGTMDLKVDHLAQTYNGADCKTCSVEIVSDTSNIVATTTGGSDGPNLPHNAVLAWVHSAWTATTSGASWIWTTYPTTDYDATHDVYYTFEKTFEWWGPVVDVSLSLGVGSDNSYEVYLNGNFVSQDVNENNFAVLDNIPAGNVTPLINQGTNTLQIRVKNWQPVGWQGTPYTNPGGLLYKLTINGNCGDDWFKRHCRLWGLKDLAQGDTFWNFDDIKPGDRGINVISLHAYDNDAYACLIANHIVDAEETVVDPEIAAGDNIASVVGELSQYIKFFAWEDDNDGVYEVGELIIAGPDSPFATAIGKISLTESHTEYIGLAWCAGTQSLNGNNIVCDGSSMGDIAQTDILSAYFTAYAEQQRNNEAFDCSKVILRP